MRLKYKCGFFMALKKWLELSVELRRSFYKRWNYLAGEVDGLKKWHQLGPHLRKRESDRWNYLAEFVEGLKKWHQLGSHLRKTESDRWNYLVDELSGSSDNTPESPSSEPEVTNSEENNNQHNINDIVLITGTETDYISLPSNAFIYNGDVPTINWGDGTPTEQFSDDVSHGYINPGTYEITISGDVTGFNSSAFDYNSHIVSIFIPDTITYIGDYCFKTQNVDELTLNFESITPPTIHEDAFYDWYDGMINRLIIKVPSGSLSAYKNAQYFPPESTSVIYEEYTSQ